MLYSFDGYVVDSIRFELRYRGELIAVEPKVYNLLQHFAANPGQVFSTDQLIDSVWEGRNVSDSTVASCVKNARKALNSRAPTFQILETVRGRGFRFNADVRITDPSESSTPTTSRQDSLTYLSLLILPFRCLSEHSKVQRAVEGLANDLGSLLNRIPLLSQSVEASRYHGREVHPTAQEIHEDLAVNFVLEGTVHQIGNTVRTNVTLANCRTGLQVWAETIENDCSISAWQTQCLHSIIGRLEPKLLRAMHQEMDSISSSVTAQQLYLEANIILMRNGWNHVAIPTTHELLRKSCQLDPEFALAPSLNAMLLGFGNKIGLLDNSEQLKQEAMRFAETALSIDNMDSTVLGLAGCCIADIGYPERGEALLRNAIDLNSGNAQAWVALGAVQLLRRNLSDALKNLSHGIQISPLDSRLSMWGAIHSAALLLSGAVQNACIAAELACQRHDNTYQARVVLAGARLAAGDFEKAKHAMLEARRIKPDLSDLQIASLVGKDLHAGLVQL